jgi:hypothetical protein
MTEFVEAVLGKKSETHEMVEVIAALSAYVADYIMEEQARGNTTVDKWMVMDAIAAYKGGAR